MSQGDSPQSRESCHACRDELGLGCKQKKLSKKNSNFFFQNFFWPRSLTRYPPSTSESFTLMGSAMWESITDKPGKSAVLSYQSLARFARSALIMVNKKAFEWKGKKIRNWQIEAKENPRRLPGKRIPGFPGNDFTGSWKTTSLRYIFLGNWGYFLR